MAKKSAAKVRRAGKKSTARPGEKKARAFVRKVKPAPAGEGRKGGSRMGAFARLRRGGGMGAAVAVVEGAGKAWDEPDGSHEVAATKQGGISAGAVGRLKRILPRMAPMLAAMGHADRARIVAKLLEGPATYRSLQNMTQMKAGPLYYHLGELRSAGLILPKQRDLYELTRGGRNLALVMVAAESMVRDKRRRPVGVTA